MDDRERKRRRLSTTDTNAIPVTSTAASMFPGSSSPNVSGGTFNNSQRDQNTNTFNSCTLYVGGSILDMMRPSLAGSETADTLAVQADEKSLGLNELEMDSEKHFKGPHLTADTRSTSGMESVEGSAFLGTSSPSVLAREDSHLQRDPNRTNRGPDSDTLPVTLDVDPEQPPSTELQRPANASCVIYNHFMFLEGNGQPLYIPQPSTSHGDSYEHQGVSIGDVGVVTSLGDFDRFFNISLPAGHAMNPDVLPDGFYHYNLKPADVQVKPIYSPNSYIANPSVPIYIANPSVWRTRTTFQCSELEGAILTMPQGAYHQELRRNIGKFRDYAATNLASWYDYANIVHGLELDNGDIRLVIECDKTTSWGIATYSHSQSKHEVTNLSFNVNSEGHSLYPKYAWEADGMAKNLKVGPEDVELLDPPEDHARVPLRNQCTFIHSLNLALGDKEWKQHQLRMATSAKAQASAQPTYKSSFTSISGAMNSPSRYLSGGYDGQHFHGHSTSGLSVAPTQIPLVYHPATPIISMLLQKGKGYSSQ